MKFKAIATSGLVATLSFAPVEPARADGDAIVGGIIGGIIGGAIANEANKKRTTTKRVYTKKSTKAKPSISTAQREENREVQTALNYFGYPVGTPDGAIGPKSRAAISQYQAMLGYPATGQITEHERMILVTAYHRAVAGGPQVAQTVASHPFGIRGLLFNQRDEMAGVAPGMMAAAPLQPVQPVQPGAAAVATVAGATAALPELIPEEPAEEVAAAPEAPALPNFMGTAMAQVSLASQCNKVSLLTNSNGGYVTAAAMTDPVFALSEQFCLARTYAMATGEELAAKVAGFSPAQIADQCAAFGPVLKDHVAALSLKPRDDVLAGVSAFVVQSGMSPAQLAGTAKICLGVGYTTDNMDVAIGSALLLTAMGENAYAELAGHHLSQGFGANPRPDLAFDWYQTALDAMATGGGVFAPGLTDRRDLIEKASFTLVGRGAELAPVPEAQTLPVFAPAETQMTEAPAMEAPAVEAPAVDVAVETEPPATEAPAVAVAEAPAEAPAVTPGAPGVGIGTVIGAFTLPLRLVTQ